MFPAVLLGKLQSEGQRYLAGRHQRRCGDGSPANIGSDANIANDGQTLLNWDIVYLLVLKDGNGQFPFYRFLLSLQPPLGNSLLPWIAGARDPISCSNLVDLVDTSNSCQTNGKWVKFRLPFGN